MALTNFEKDYIAGIVSNLPRSSPAMVTATQGTEAQRKTLIAEHIAANGALDAVAADIAACDLESTAIAARKAALETKLAAMETYGA